MLYTIQIHSVVEQGVNLNNKIYDEGSNHAKAIIKPLDLKNIKIMFLRFVCYRMYLSAFIK